LDLLDSNGFKGQKSHFFNISIKELVLASADQDARQFCLLSHHPLAKRSPQVMKIAHPQMKTKFLHLLLIHEECFLIFHTLGVGYIKR
jgi:hypothetical protein